MNRDKRRHPRFRCLGAAKVQLCFERPPVSARIMDLSLEGCLIILEAGQKVSEGALAELTFTVKGLPFRVRGQVRATQSETRIGFRFENLSNRAKQQLGDLVEELTQEHKQQLRRLQERELRIQLARVAAL